MKAALIRRKVTPPKTHDLVRLSNRLAKAVPGWDWNEEELRLLSAGAVILRYPGRTSTRDEARQAMKQCKLLRNQLLKLI
jgi:HEPN domain-containing protein